LLKRNSSAAPRLPALTWLKSGQNPALKVTKVLRPSCQPAASWVGEVAPALARPGRISMRSIGTPRSWISVRSSSLERALDKYESVVANAFALPSAEASFAG
jgi:hypothetical protein